MPSGESAPHDLSPKTLANCYQCGKLHRWLSRRETRRCGFQPGDALAAVGTARNGYCAWPAIWQCVWSQTCSSALSCEHGGLPGSSTMCGKERLSGGLRSFAPVQQRIVIFQKAFLNNVRRNGRVNELELTARFKIGVLLRTRQTGLAV